MKPGQAATVKVDAFEGVELTGQVESLSGGTGARFALLPPDNASGNFVKVVQRVPVRIELKGVPADLPLRAGLSAEVSVKVEE
jgi:membrane fusion protein (multidrug efflux system)